MEFLYFDIPPGIQWLIENLWILLIFFYKKINNFFLSIKDFFQTTKDHFIKVDKTLIKLLERSEQHETRLKNLERI